MRRGRSPSRRCFLPASPRRLRLEPVDGAAPGLTEAPPEVGVAAPGVVVLSDAVSPLAADGAGLAAPLRRRLRLRLRLPSGAPARVSSGTFRASETGPSAAWVFATDVPSDADGVADESGVGMALLSLNCSSSLTEPHNPTRRLSLLLLRRVGLQRRNPPERRDPWAGWSGLRHASWVRCLCCSIRYAAREAAHHELRLLCPGTNGEGSGFFMDAIELA